MLLGEPTNRSIDAFKQICLTLSAHGWHRFIAVLAQVYRQRILFFPSFKDGISFGNSHYSNTKSPRKRAKPPGAPIEGPLLKKGQESE